MPQAIIIFTVLIISLISTAIKSSPKNNTSAQNTQNQQNKQQPLYQRGFQTGSRQGARPAHKPVQRPRAKSESTYSQNSADYVRYNDAKEFRNSKKAERINDMGHGPYRDEVDYREMIANTLIILLIFALIVIGAVNQL